MLPACCEQATVQARRRVLELDSAPMENDAPARAFGRYEIVQTLGQGGMGEVHLARLTGVAGFEKLCIVKTILPHLAADKTFLERFLHEAKILVHLAHSNIAQIYDMGESDGTCYM